MNALISLALASAWNRRLTLGLALLSIMLATSLMLSVERLRHQAEDSFAATVSGTDLIFGARGSALGFFFARKSALRQRAFRQDRARVEGFLRTVTEHLQTTGPLDPSIRNYRTFIEKKLPQRARFYRLFKRWNFAFLGGSSLYAASALTKAVLGIAALAGAGALISNPVGWGILLGVGVVGAVVMGVASWQFLFGHPKNERYEHYFRDDHPELDRPFLTTLEIAPPEDGGPRWRGVLLRAQLFEQLEKHADALDRLKNRIARGMGKKPAATLDDFLPNLQARLAALGAGAGALLRTGRLDEARSRAHQTWSSRARHLTEANIASWIGSRDAQTAWPRLSKRYLIAQREYLQHKLSCRLSLLERLRLCLSIKEPDTERADRLLLGILSGVKDSALDALDARAVRREWATTLMCDQPRCLRDFKGILLETEMQAAPLRASSTLTASRSRG